MRKKFQFAVLLFASVSFFNLSCRKEVTPLKTVTNEKESSITNSTASKSGKIIKVSNVNELYNAVNDTANAGCQIELKKGKYILSPNYPNRGRLELQFDMDLIGKQNHPEDVIIDASALPDSSFNPLLNFPARRTGAIRMGRGLNKIEWLKVIGNSNSQPLSVIDTDLIWAGVSRVRIANTIITGGRIGIDIRNVGAASAGRIIEAEIVDNEITGNLVSDPGTQQGQGIVMQNANGATGAIIQATLSGNNVHGNIIGMRLFNNNGNPNTHTDNSSISVLSYGDRFDENKQGINLTAASNQGANSTVNGNFISFEAQGTSIRNNQGILPDPITLPCGIRLTGGFNSLAGSESSNNRLEMKLTNCAISGNQDYDIISYGAFSTTTTLAGTNNVVNIHLNGISANAIVAPPTPSVPTEAAGTNIVNVFR